MVLVREDIVVLNKWRVVNRVGIFVLNNKEFWRREELDLVGYLIIFLYIF